MDVFKPGSWKSGCFTLSRLFSDRPDLMEWVSEAELSSPSVLLCNMLKGDCVDKGDDICCKGGVSTERGVSALVGGGVSEGDFAAGTGGNTTAGKAADGRGADPGATCAEPEGEGSRGTSGIGRLPGTRIVFLFLLPRFVAAL